jgi:HAD superfamily hydrolase (TIGR01509 family)
MAAAVIFDVDGTLVDSVDLHARAWQDAFREFGPDIGFVTLRGQIGKGGDQLMPEFLTSEQLGRYGAELEGRRGDIFRRRYMDQVVAFPQVRPLFQRLLEDGVRIALASSAKPEELQDYKQLTRIADLIDAETTADDVESSKPAPDIFAAALQRLGNVDAREVLAVGDTPYDAQAASKAGLRCLGMLCGGWPEQDLRGAGCVAIYQDPQSLLTSYGTSLIARGRSAGDT